MPGHHVHRLLLIAGGCTLLLAACGGDAGTTSGLTNGSSVPFGAPGAVRSGAAPQAQLPAAAQAAPLAPPPAQPAPGAANSASGGSGSGGALAQAPAGGTSTPINLGTVQGQIERSVTAQYVVPHGDFLQAFDAVVQRATTLGGYVMNSTTTPDSTGRIASGSVTVKVPAAQLSTLIAGLPADFTVSALNYGSQDLTSQYVDLNARISAATAQRTALEGLLSQARSIADITSLQQQIAQVQLEIDQDQGALNAVDSSVSLATATIGLSEKGAKPAPPPPVHTDPALLHALRTGAGNAIELVADGLLGIVTALPVILLALAGWLGRRRIRRLLDPQAPSS